MNLLNQYLKSIQMTKAYYKKLLKNDITKEHKEKIEKKLEELTIEEKKILEQINE